MQEKAEWNCVLGRIFWKQARRYVEIAQREGLDLNHYESTGFSMRKFTIRGNPQHVAHFSKVFRKHMDM